MQESSSERDRSSTHLPPGDVTELLERWSEGDESAFRALVPIVYDELKRIAGRFLQSFTLRPSSANALKFSRKLKVCLRNIPGRKIAIILSMKLLNW